MNASAKAWPYQGFVLRARQARLAGVNDEAGGHALRIGSRRPESRGDGHREAWLLDPLQVVRRGWESRSAVSRQRHEQPPVPSNSNVSRRKPVLGGQVQG